MAWEDELKSKGFTQVVELLLQWKEVLGDERLSALTKAILADSKTSSSEFSAAAAASAASAASTPTVVDSSPVVATISQVSFLSPRGKFDVDLHKTGAITFRGKNSDVACACATNSIDLLFKLPIPQGAQKVRTVMAAVVLKEAVTFGKSKLPYLVVQSKDTDSLQASILEEAAFGKAVDAEGGTVKGTPTDVLLSLLSGLASKPIQEHNKNTFLSFKAEGAVKCNIKSVHDGFLFCYDAGLFFVSKFLFLARHQIHSFDFGRTSSVSARTFDVTVVLKSGEKHEFSMIDKDEHQRLLEYAQALKLKPKDQAGPLPKDGGKAAVKAEEGGGQEAGQGQEGSGAVQQDAPGEEEEEEEESEEDDDFEPGDGDDSDESEGYDAVEAMDADDIKDQEEGGDEEDDDEEEDDGEGGDETDEEVEDEQEEGGSGSKRSNPVEFDPAKDKVAYRPGAPVADEGGPGESKRMCL